MEHIKLHVPLAIIMEGNAFGNGLGNTKLR